MRTIKIKLNPTPSQKKIFKRWAGTTRHVYNRVLQIVKFNPKLASKNGEIELTKQCINELNNEVIEEWEEIYYDKRNDKYIFDWVN